MATVDAEIASGTTYSIRMPEESQDGTRAVLGALLKQVGDAVTAHEPVAEVETDKVVVEVAASADGVLSAWHCQPGDELSPGMLLATVTTATAPPAAPQRADDPPTPSAAADGPTTRPDNVDARRRLSPAVKRLLADHALAAEEVLPQIAGTGRDGRVSAADLRRFLAKEGPSSRPGDQALTSPATPQAHADTPSAMTAGRRIPLSPMRRAIAEHMSRSLLRTAPHVTTVFECDMTRVLAHRRANREDYKSRGADLTLTAYFMAAAATALRAVPEVNSSLQGDELVLHEQINIGIAVALGRDGLVVPVLRDIQQMNLFGIAAGLSTLTERARERRLDSNDMQGGTFTISNHGVSGSLLATPVIINQPESAILGVGKLRKEVVVREVDGEDIIRIAPLCYLTLTLDHRVLDAYAANEFLSRLVRELEQWSAA